MKIYKISAGVRDFMEGLRTQDISMMPPESQLTPEQKREIGKKTLDINNPVIRLRFFNKYPKDAYLNLWNLISCINYGVDNNAIMQAWSNFKKLPDVANCGFPEDMPLWMVQDIVKSRLKISPESAGSIFIRKEKYPDFFIDYVSKKYPLIYKGYLSKDDSTIKSLIKNYIQFPTEEGYYAIEVALNRKEINRSNDKVQLRHTDDRIISKEIVRFGFESKLPDYISNIGHSVPHVYQNDEWDTKSITMFDEISKVVGAINKGQNIEANESQPFSYKIESTRAFGPISILTLGNDVIVKKSLLNNILKIINQHPTDYWTLYWGKNVSRKLEGYGIQVEKDMKEGVYLIADSDNVYFDVTQGSKNIASPRNADRYFSTDYLSRLISRTTNVTDEEYANIFTTWISERHKSDTYNINHMYLDIINTKGVKNLTDKAGTDLFQSKIQNYSIKDKKDFDPFVITKPYGEVWPFSINAAAQFWSNVPMQIRNYAANDISIWYLCLSGYFSCNKISEKMSKNIYDLKKVIDSISCIGNEAETKQNLKAMVESKEKESIKQIKEKFPEFLKSGLVKSYNLSSFPDLYEYTKNLLNKHIDKERGQIYSPTQQKHMTPLDFAMESLNNVNIYLINTADYKAFWGEEGMMFAPVSPDNCSGFFAPAYSIWGDKPTVVIFANNTQDVTPETILKELSIETTSGSMGFSEESTLWHEISHAFMNYVLPGRYEDQEDVQKQSVDTWMTSPSEIAAINYGNIPFIKRKLRQYFEKMFPFNERITAGLMSQMKSDIVETFAFEFHGYPKAQALQMIGDSMPDFEQETIDMLNSMPREEQINHMTNMFSEFFIRKFMRSKIESTLRQEVEDIGGDYKKIEFKEEQVVPEDDSWQNKMPGQRDEFISKIQSRPDYQQFLNNCQNQITEDYTGLDKKTFFDRYHRFINRDQAWILRPLFTIEDVLMLLFLPPSTIYGVDLNQPNHLFYGLASQSLISEITNIVKNERALSSGNEPIKQKKTPVTPQEAEEAGEFLSNMEESHGADWIWMAKNKMNWYKQAQIQEKTFWHISNARFKKFDFYKSAQGIIWFAKDKEDLIKNLHGASINNKNPIYLYKCQINMGKVAGWNEYEKYGLGQLKSEGYDTINLDDDVAVLEPKNITILGIEQIR